MKDHLRYACLVLHRHRLWSVLALLLMSLTPSYGATQSLTIAADDQFEFAGAYFSSGEYYRAIGEYERFIFFFPGDPRVEKAMHRIAMSYYRGRQFTDAISSFQRLTDRYHDTELATHSHLMISECFLRSKQPAQALARLNGLLAIDDDAGTRDEVNYRIAWIYLEQGSWEMARTFLGKIGSANRTKYQVQQLHAALGEENLPGMKNPRLAGILSVMPGAGYAYLGRYRDAFTALLFNGGIIFASVTAFEDDNPALGGLLAFVGTGFYSGNIFGSVSGAHKHNRNRTGQFLDRLKNNTKIHLSADGRQEGVRVTLRYAF